MKIVNLTPHAITIQTSNWTMVVPPSGEIARVQVSESSLSSLTFAEGRVPLVKRVWGEVEGLPEPTLDTIFIVSSLVLDRCQGRRDVFAPDTGPTALRDDMGRIEAVTRLIQAPR